ncbi:hypothetical protein [Brevundimonas sp.]|uniref:hypothetical protein n=1 Tax=Brevundimonas sp. TaxID=1871086 RepID=UPI0028B1E7E7|nr:hypothetical protein [Brevundimonas sp.]
MRLVLPVVDVDAAQLSGFVRSQDDIVIEGARPQAVASGDDQRSRRAGDDLGRFVPLGVGAFDMGDRNHSAALVAL